MRSPSSSTSASNLTYYQTLYNYVKGKSGTAQVVANPGTQVDESFLNHASGPTADTLVIFVNNGTAYQSFTPDAWVTSGAPIEFLIALGYYCLYPENHGAVCGIAEQA